MSNVDIVTAHYAASDRGDLEGMLAPFADDIEWTEMAGSDLAGTYRGREAVAERVFGGVGSAWDDFRVTIDELLDAGETVVAIGSYSGTFRATGKPMVARVAHVWRVRDGRLAAFEQFADTFKLREAATP